MQRGAAASCPQCASASSAGHRFCSGCGQPVGEACPPDEQDPLVGQALPGGLRVLALEGSGGMGKVYRAEQRLLGRTVAVKVMHAHLLGDETIEARFLTEARAASRLNHPNSVSVIDFGVFDGRPYLVMEFLQGRDLATVMQEEGPFSDDRIVDVLGQILAALEEAHLLGIVHRDLKPENVIIQSLRSSSDFVKVVDFGLAKLLEPLGFGGPTSGGRLTVPGLVCGTPHFMAPEQVRGEAVDGRTDLYACGVMLFEMLTGTLPFDAASVGEIVAMQLHDPPPDPRAIAPGRGITPEAADVVLRALAKQPTERFQTAAAFAEALRAALVGEAPATGRYSGQRVRCPRCRSLVGAGQRFCGSCGQPVKPKRSDAPASGGIHSSAPPSSRGEPRDGSEPRMVDREGDLAQLDQAHVAATTGFRGHRLVGPVGVGKTYLLEAFLRRRRLAGDVVALAGPDPWRARVRYSTLRSIIGSLLELPAADIPGAAGADAPAEARVGLNLLYGVGSDHGAEPLRHWSDGPPRAWRHAERRRLAAEALRWAMTRAHAERPDATIVVAVDDLQAVDGASRNALADVAGSPPPIPLLLLAAHEPGFEPRWTASQEHVLRGFGPTHVTELLDAGPPVSVPRLALSDPGAGPQEVRPLHVEQLQRFLAEGGANPPAGVADLVAARLGRLTAQRRRILQAVAVLGDGASADAIAEMLATSDPLSRELDRLRARGWLTVIPEPDELWSMHPLVRDVTLASMPAEIRRELHGRARAVSAHQGAPRPVEVDAQHACGAGQSFEALMLLERVATRSAVCGDFDGAVRALRQGLELGREEIVRGEIDDPVGATLWFSCRLGDVLALDGDLRNADGVLREALDQAGPASGLRPRILASLAHVCHQRGRSAQARELLDEAHRLAAERGRRGVLEACVQLRMSWVGQEAG